MKRKIISSILGFACLLCAFVMSSAHAWDNYGVSKSKIIEILAQTGTTNIDFICGGVSCQGVFGCVCNNFPGLSCKTYLSYRETEYGLSCDTGELIPRSITCVSFCGFHGQGICFEGTIVTTFDCRGSSSGHGDLGNSPDVRASTCEDW